ncbi:hypothetical protein [Xenorhabdus sp. IM139775]|uniref:hypothetical protein n=1 Tax=Xenorhabdus sp. IM139775 TaxID=3025876 RepID=UPI002358E6D5|nr:hypothetical protein [Xenorhabdus sp. IM139775]MDC9593501.1 hypothetical protein [Xenorhabdus sp. IM139775]
MKNVIFCLSLLLLSGCALSKPPDAERTIALDSKAIDSLIAVATIFNEDKDTHTSGGKSLIDWDTVKLKDNKVTADDIVRIIQGQGGEGTLYSQNASGLGYSMYYLITLSNPTKSCLYSAECVLKLLKHGASEMSEKRDQAFLKSYIADNKKFKYTYFDPEKIIPMMKGLADSFTEMKNREIAENATLPDTQPIEFSYSNDGYVNVAIALLNNARLEEYNIRDRDGNKTEKYGNPTIYGRPLFSYPYMYKNTLVKQAKSCEKTSVYAKADINNACKRAIIAGVKDWLATARDPDISRLAWKMAASQSIFRGEIVFSHWAGMARVHQKSLNETGRLSL